MVSSPGLTVVGGGYEPVVRPELTVRLPGDGEPHAAVVLPDGETCVVSAENGGELYRVSLRTGEVATLHGGHGMPVNDLALAAGGRLLLSASDDATVRVWDTAWWRVSAVLEGHQGYIRSVAGAASTAVTGGEDRTVRVWDLRTCRQLAVFEDHGESVDQVAISADGLRAASSTRDNGMRLWDLAAPDGPRLQQQLYGATAGVHYIPGGFLGASVYVPLGFNDTGVGHQKSPSALLFGPDGDLFSADDEIIRWDPVTGAERWRAAPQAIEPSALALHPALPLLLSATIYGIQVLSLAEPGRPRRTAALAVGEAATSALAFTGDGRPVSVHEDRMLRLWPALDGAVEAGPRHAATVEAISCAPNGRWAATHCSNREVMLWDLADGSRLAVLDEHSRQVTERTSLVEAPVFLSGGRTVALHDQQRVHLWETGAGATGTVRTLEPAADEDADAPAWITKMRTADQETVLVELYGRPLELWPVSGGERRKLEDAAGARTTTAVSTPDGRWLLTTSSLEQNHPLLAGTPASKAPGAVLGLPALQCWDLATGRLGWTRYATGERPWPACTWVRARADGTVLTPFCESGDGLSLLVLDPKTGAELTRISMPEHSCDHAPLAEADGALLFTGWQDRESGVWRLPPDGERLVQLVAPPGPARTLLPVPGRPLLLRYAGEEVSLHALDADTPELSRVLLPAPVREGAVAPDGRSAVLADRTGAVHILRIDW